MKNNGIFGIALVGCGGMASNYCHRYIGIPGACLRIVEDVDEAVAKNAAEALHIERWSTDFKDVLTDDIDMVDISTPNFLHETQALAAIAAGKHVLIQKPLANSVKAAEAIVSKARQKGIQAGMYMSMFDHPIYHDIKRILDRGLLGRISGVHCRGAHRGGLTIPEGNWRRSLEKTGGGAFIQLAVHQMNMVQWMLNAKIIRVAAFSKNLMCPNIGGDDITSVACEFKNGIQGTLESAYCAGPNILALYGTKGYISAVDDCKLDIMMDDSYKGEVIKYPAAGKLETINIGMHYGKLVQTDNPYDQHVAFVQAVMQGRPAPVPVEAGLYDMRVVEAIYRSAAEKKFVEI